MAKQSAGILAYKFVDSLLVFLVHPGGPFFKNKDEGFWTIPKGEIDADEDPLLAAQREFFEETGTRLEGHFIKLTPIKQKAGKVVQAWAIEHDVDDNIVSNTFNIVWPPKSGKMSTFPEVDRAAWFTIEQATKKINVAQLALIKELHVLLNPV